MVGAQSKVSQLQKDKKRLDNEISVLKDQITIYRQEFRIMNKRQAPAEPEDAMAIQEATMREIKRRRDQNIASEAPVTLDERRAMDKAKITEIIKDY